MAHTLGISLSAHGALVALASDGALVRAARLERHSRVKRAVALRRDAPGAERLIAALDLPDGKVLPAEQWLPELVGAVLAAEGLMPGDVAAVARPEHDLLDLGGDRAEAEALLPAAPIIRLEHHRAHAAQAFLPSGFERAAVLTVDGFGEHLERHEDRQLSCSLGRGAGGRVEVLEEIVLPFSVGVLYAAATSYLGFRPGQEGKTMGLAAWGDRRYVAQVAEAFDLEGPLPNCLKDWPARPVGDLLGAVGAWLAELGPARHPQGLLTAHHKAVARAVQDVTERMMVQLAREALRVSGESQLCIAGGVGLNCVANRRILDATEATELFVTPEPGDPGLALGLALEAAREVGDAPRGLRHDFLGIPPSDVALERTASRARERGLRVTRPSGVADAVAERIAAGSVVGRFFGASEIGPRALGHRSILADPRDPAMRDRLNAHIKRREGFRPFAPSALAERSGELFELEHGSDFMLLTAPVRSNWRRALSAATHIDGQARVHTVDGAADPGYAAIIGGFGARTGCPAIVNTSFNVAGQPVVETPDDALGTFLDAGLDALQLGPWMIDRV